MIIYRPHRGRLSNSMAEAIEFSNAMEMKKYILKDWGEELFSIDDDPSHHPRPIGLCATKYKFDLTEWLTTEQMIPHLFKKVTFVEKSIMTMNELLIPLMERINIIIDPEGQGLSKKSNIEGTHRH